MTPIESARKVLKAIDLGPRFLLVPLFLSIAAAVFEGVSTGLLVPLLKGGVQGDYSFFGETRVGAWLLEQFPGFFADKSATPFIILLGAVFATSILRIAFAYLSEITYARRLRYAMHRLRSSLFSRSIDFGKLYYDRTKQGELHHVILGFTNQIMAKLNAFHGQLKWGFMLIAYVVLMLVISWKLTLFLVCLFPIYYFSLSRLVRRIGNVSEDYATADSDLSNTFYNVISNISLVKSSGWQEREKQRFADKSSRGANLGADIDCKMLAVYPIQESITLVLAMLLVGGIAYIVSNDPSEDVSGFLVYLYLLKRSSTAFSTLGDARGVIASIRGLLAQIASLLEDKDKHFIDSGDTPFPGLTDVIEFRNLDFDYTPGVTVLRDVSLEVERGRVTALVGPSGSGKTTLVQLLLRYYDCNPGTVFVDGKDIREFDINSLLSRIAHVSQDTYLFNDTLRYNLTYGLDREIPDHELRDALVQSRLEEFIETLPKGLETLVGDRGVQLSGGEKQRVSIARAILREPEILILDEATSALDSTTERMIQAALDELVEDRTVIVIAHRFSTLKNADKIVTLDDGAIVESGSLDELLNRGGKFSDLWKDQELFH